MAAARSGTIAARVWSPAGLQVPDVRELARHLAAAAGKRLDDAAPIADGRLPDGTRLHAVLAPLEQSKVARLAHHRQQSGDEHRDARGDDVGTRTERELVAEHGDAGDQQRRD